MPERLESVHEVYQPAEDQWVSKGGAMISKAKTFVDRQWAVEDYILEGRPENYLAFEGVVTQTELDCVI